MSPPGIKRHFSPQSTNIPDQSMAQKMLADHAMLPDFLDRFHLVSELGSGGFGFVLGAIDTHTNREVAAKFILKARVAASSWVRDPDYGVIPMEVYFLRHCGHKNIISFVTVYSDDKFVYLITELHGSQWHAAKTKLDMSTPPHDDPIPDAAPPASAAAEALRLDMLPPSLSRSNTCPLPIKLCRRPSMDLFECIEQFDRIPESTARFIFRQVAEAVRYLHSRGVVHRDIKDENIVIDDKFHVKLIDFGSAAIEPDDPTHLFDRFQGTIQYASPEILRGEKYRGRPTDIWALGILLYTILYGEVPFASSEQAKTLGFKHPRFPSSTECMNLLAWMLQKHASKRPTAEQILRHPWLTQQPSLQPPPMLRATTSIFRH